MAEHLAQLGWLALLGTALAGFLMAEFRRDAGGTLRSLLAWGMIFLGLVAAAGLWSDVRRRELPHQQSVTPARIEVPLGRDGHFHIRAEVHGVPVRFVVDTGASQLALSPRDAGRVGIDPQRLAYASEAQTANGIVRTAAVRLDSLRIGAIEDRDVPAIVIDGALDSSLMGMDYLRRFARVGFEGQTLVLER